MNNKYKKIKNILLVSICALVVLVALPIQAEAAQYWPEGPEVTSPCVIVMEADTGTILYEKSIHEQHYPASITKIMTTLLALENSSMDEVVTFSHDAVYNTEGSSIMRDVGEEMTMEQCLYAIMLNSSNESAYAVAEHIGGDYAAFIDMMNERAQELGCVDTHFANPHGLTDPEHYTSCYDMALIAQEAYKNENFRIITSTARYTIPPTNKHTEETYLQNHNEMLYPWQTLNYRYEYCTGGKTGYTQAANSTLVTFAEKDDMKLICVIMNTISPSQWLDTINLYDYCFDNFQILNVADNETRFENEDVKAGALNVNEPYAKLDSDGKIILPTTAEFSDTESSIKYENTNGNVIATIEYSYADHNVGGADIVTTGARIGTYPFDNTAETETAKEAVAETETQQAAGSKKIFQINLRFILLVILGLAGVVILVFLLKKFADNFYLIRRKLFPNLGSGRKRYRKIKNTRKGKRRRRR